MRKDIPLTRVLIFPLFLLAIGFSTWHSGLKFEALDYHTRDFAFFAQTQARLSDPDLSPHLSLNPDGHNFFGLRGTECEKSIHQGIHFAPIKYIHALLFSITGNLLPVFLFNAVIVFFPAFYLTFYLQKGSPPIDRRFFFLLSLCYLLYPSVQHLAVYDLRHYIFLTPLFVTAVLANMLGRPVIERLFFFNLLFFAREESLVLGSVVIFYVIATSEKPTASSILRHPVVWYLICYVFWYTAIVTYFIWTGYRQEHSFILRSLMPLLFLFFGCLTTVLLRRYGDMRMPRISREIVGFIALLMVFGPFVYHGGIWRHVEPYSILFFDRYFLYAGCGFVCIAALWRLVSNRTVKRAMLISAAVSCLFLLFANSPLMPMPGHVSYRERPISVEVQENLAKKAKGRLVHEMRDRLDYRRSFVLTDYNTHQAFFDFENVFVYQRLPWYLVPGKERYYPANRSMLRELLRTRIEYIVISSESYPDVWQEIQSVGLQEHSKTIERNDAFVSLKIIRSGDPPVHLPQ